MKSMDNFKANKIFFSNDTEISVTYSYNDESGKKITNTEEIAYWNAKPLDDSKVEDFTKLSTEEQRKAIWGLDEVFIPNTFFNRSENFEYYDCGTTDGCTTAEIKDYFEGSFDELADEIETRINNNLL